MNFALFASGKGRSSLSAKIPPYDKIPPYRKPSVSCENSLISFFPRDKLNVDRKKDYRLWYGGQSEKKFVMTV